uniref:uncharacterized protein LOC122602258 isoform X2 n=1 Tax=Erigeron canadensis TaxID=72917 RepID=UPI001CB91972|nr:uncharacterized protein LOC122602258 isoform X2 [Erigeron canadensis]XP_043630902.1 uncharacterized protein LOC122602258 isoform X2 [Erigeron canadensis]
MWGNQAVVVDECIACDNNPHSANQGMVTPDSLFPPSEPPDIKNWFSSYENESLVLETNDIFGFSDHQDSDDQHCLRGECTSRELAIKEMNNTPSMLKQVNESRNQDSDSPDSPLLTLVESQPPGIENWFPSYAYESPVPDDDVDRFVLSPIYKENMVVGDGKQVKEVEKAENLAHVPSDEMICHQMIKVCHTDNDSTECLKDSTELPDEDANMNSPKYVNQMLPEAISLDANGDGDGFVSIQKNKSKIENYNNSMRGDHQKRASSYVSKTKKGNESAGRKILGDVTNVDEHSGKWKCPQKRKPDIGPPLKQLRLGKWFHYA